jgi:hypothetical protein
MLFLVIRIALIALFGPTLSKKLEKNGIFEFFGFFFSIFEGGAQLCALKILKNFVCYQYVFTVLRTTGLNNFFDIFPYKNASADVL